MVREVLPMGTLPMRGGSNRGDTLHAFRRRRTRPARYHAPVHEPRLPEPAGGLPFPLRMAGLRPERAALLRAALDPAAAAGLALTGATFDAAATRRLAPAIAARALEAGAADAALEPFVAQLRASAARWLRFRAMLQRIGEALGAAGVAWLPIKGADVATRVYPDPAERPASDLDILVRPAEREAAFAALETAGFRRWYPRNRYTGDFHDREAHNVLFASPEGLPVEVHYRLWGMVPPAFTAGIHAAAEAAPELGATALRPALHHEIVLTAVHAWHTSRPRPLTQLLDIVRLTAKDPCAPGLAAEAALRHGLQLPTGLVLLDAGVTCGVPELERSAAPLLARLRPPERLVLSRFIRTGEDGVPITAVFLATLLARRPRRRGPLALVRRLWPHPHVVALSTPDTLPWWRRRLLATARELRSGR